MKVAMDCGMVEILERPVETTYGPAEAFEQRRRACAGLRQRDAVEIRDQPREMAAAGRDAYRVARDRGQNARAERHAVRHVRHRGVLGLEHGAMFRRVRDFEYVAARAGCQQEVLVALAWKRGGGRIESVHLAREPSRAGGVEPRRLPRQPVVQVWLHSGPPTRLPRWGPRSTGDASPPHPNAAAALGTPARAALLLAQILPVFSFVAPYRRGASPVSVRRQTFTTGR